MVSERRGGAEEGERRSPRDSATPPVAVTGTMRPLTRGGEKGEQEARPPTLKLEVRGLVPELWPPLRIVPEMRPFLQSGHSDWSGTVYQSINE